MRQILASRDVMTNFAPFVPRLLMSGAPSPLSSSVQSLLEQKRADNELSELEQHLLLQAESLVMELEKRDKHHEAEKEQLRKKLAVSELEVKRLEELLETPELYGMSSWENGATSSSAKRRMSVAEPKPPSLFVRGGRRHRIDPNHWEAKREMQDHESDEETDAEIQAVLRQTADVNTKPFSRYTG